MTEERFAPEELEYVADDLFIPYIIKCAKSGCKASARTLMQFAAGYLQAGKAFPESLQPYLADAFQAIAKGESADKALFLSHGRGKNDTALYRKQAIAGEVRRLYWVGEAKTIEDACQLVSVNGAKMPISNELIYAPPKTAYKYYYEIFPGTPSRCPV